MDMKGQWRELQTVSETTTGNSSSMFYLWIGRLHFLCFLPSSPSPLSGVCGSRNGDEMRTAAYTVGVLVPGRQDSLPSLHRGWVAYSALNITSSSPKSNPLFYWKFSCVICSLYVFCFIFLGKRFVYVRITLGNVSKYLRRKVD